jgi:hypothetical protein
MRQPIGRKDGDKSSACMYQAVIQRNDLLRDFGFYPPRICKPIKNEERKLKMYNTVNLKQSGTNKS